MSSQFEGFPKSTFRFLRELKKNNNREWFKSNKHRYESDVLAPSLEFIQSVKSGLKKISPYFNAVPKRTGGSLMRVYRDTRFSKDKTPYKTNIGIHFRHEFGRDVHAPGFYLHLDPKESFFGAGIWRPDNKALKKIRDQIVEEHSQYGRIIRSKKITSQFEFGGDSLIRPPRGYNKDHPLIGELRRKDFILIGEINKNQVGTIELMDQLLSNIRTSMPMIRFLCNALILPS